MGWNDIEAQIAAINQEGKILAYNRQTWGGPVGIEESMRDDLLTKLGYLQSGIPPGTKMRIKTGGRASDSQDVLQHGRDVVLFPEEYLKTGEPVRVVMWVCQYIGTVKSTQGLKVSVTITEVTERVTRDYGSKLGDTYEVDVSYVTKLK